MLLIVGTALLLISVIVVLINIFSHRIMSALQSVMYLIVLHALVLQNVKFVKGI